MLISINRLESMKPPCQGPAEARVGSGPAACDFRHGRKRALCALGRVGVATLFFAFFASSAQADPQSELAQARHDLSISEQVLARVTERVHAARSDAATAPEERRRLDAYLARIRDLVALNRERVRALEQAVTTLPAGTGPAVGAGASGAPGATTDAEEVAALDARLSGSLAEFDQLLLEEARKARARAPTRASAAGSTGGSSGGTAATGGPSSAGDGSSATGGATSADGETDPRQSGRGPGSPGGRIEGTDPGTPGATAAVPPDVGDGSDDDIVARQIRRAAESEADPALRDKLWEEYRKYKRGTQG